MASDGRAHFGVHRDWSVLALEGDIRFTLVRGLEAFVSNLLQRDDFDTMLVDMRATSNIDSTGIGLLARIAGHVIKSKGRRAVLICPPGDVKATLCAVDFEMVFDVVDQPPGEMPQTTEIPCAELADSSGRSVGRVVLDAHHDLMKISERNREEFGQVVETLEREVRAAENESPAAEPGRPAK